MEGKPLPNGSHEYEKQLQEWIVDEKAAIEFIHVIGQLWFDKSVELVLFRNQLIDRSASDILHKHSYAKNIIKREINVQDSLLLAKVILSMDMAPSRIDIGRLNSEWVEERKKFASMQAFVADKLSAFRKENNGAGKPRDVVLYGFGRIGRLLARELIRQAGNGSQLRLRAIVTRTNSAEDIIKRASLFRKDSVHGPFQGVAIEEPETNSMFINGHRVKFLVANNPEDIDYEAEGITDALLIDNTGIYRDRASLSRHLKAKGIAKVLLTAPGKGDLPDIVYGVNHLVYCEKLESEHIYTAASCTTNAVVPVLSVIEKELGIVKGHIETIHSYTNDQNLLDNFHKKYRRGRSAPLNMVITETGAGKAAAKAIPSLAGKLTANAVRVPTPNVSLAILALTVATDTYREEVNEILRTAALKGNLVEQIRYSTSNELVSSDVIGDSCASVVDSPATIVGSDKRDVVIYVWYDNEYGYSRQVIRLARYIMEIKRLRYY
jgi:glyceraldehyde 3-phosphate dehydrogenase